MISVLGQDRMFSQIKRSPDKQYVQYLRGNYFRIFNERVNVVELSDSCSQIVKECMPGGSVDSIPNELCYMYSRSPIKPTLHMKHLDGLYTVEYEGRNVYINYFHKNLYYYYVFRGMSQVWELADVQCYRMVEEKPGVISLYEYLSPHQIENQVQVLLDQGYTYRGARIKINKHLYHSPPLKKLGLVHIDREHHILLTSHINYSVAEEGLASSSNNKYNEVKYGTPRSMLAHEYAWE